MKIRNIDALIEHLQAYRARFGNIEIEVTDGYHGHSFEIYPEDRGAWDNPTRLFLRPFNVDGTQRTSGLLERI
jgi:hypothetical protein